MRFEFVKGKQRELIKTFKNLHNFTYSQLANFFGIKKGNLNSYFYETSLIPEEIYKKIDPKKAYEKFIVERKEDNWGRIKGGINSSGKTKVIDIPKDSEKLAEFYGAMLGDGSSHRTKYYKSRSNKRGVYVIRIVGDSRYDKEYLINYVKPLIEGLFGILVRSGKFKPKNIGGFNSRNAMFIESYGVKLVEFLEKKGFPPGNKIKNQLGIPQWIKNNEKYLKACIRGLYDTDGSVYKLTNQNSHQICFTNFNFKLINDVRSSLLKLGINCSKISKKDLYITKKSELRKFLKLVGFSNDRHLKKVKMWNLK